MSRKLISLLVILAVVLTFAACGQTAGKVQEESSTQKSVETKSDAASETAKAAKKDVIVGFINYSDEIDATRLVHTGMEKVAKEMGIKLIYGTAKSDAQQMVSAADNFIVQGAKAIVDFNFNQGGGAALKEKCNAAKIPLISIDMNYGDGTYFVGVNNQQAGEFAGDGALNGIKEKFGGKLDYVVITVGASLGDEINKRTRGVVDSLRKAGLDLPKDKVIEMETGSGDMTLVSKQQATDFLTAHNDAKKVLFVSGNDQGGLGIMSAIASQKRETDCLLVTHGCEQPSRIALNKSDPVWYGSVDY